MQIQSPATAISFTTLKARGLDNGDYNTVKTLYINDDVVLNTPIFIPRSINIVIKAGKTLTLGNNGYFVFTGEGKVSVIGGSIALQNNTNNLSLMCLNTDKVVDIFLDGVSFTTTNSSFCPVKMMGWSTYPKQAINVTFRSLNCTFANSYVCYIYANGCTDAKVIYNDTKLTYQSDGKYVVPQV